jgi:hypothetical protein
MYLAPERQLSVEVQLMSEPCLWRWDIRDGERGEIIDTRRSRPACCRLRRKLSTTRRAVAQNRATPATSASSRPTWNTESRSPAAVCYVFTGVVIGPGSTYAPRERARCLHRGRRQTQLAS